MRKALMPAVGKVQAISLKVLIGWLFVSPCLRFKGGCINLLLQVLIHILALVQKTPDLNCLLFFLYHIEYEIMIHRKKPNLVLHGIQRRINRMAIRINT